MNDRRAVACAVLLATQFTAGAFGVQAQETVDCGGRASLRVLVVDDSGVVPIPNATVVLRWTESDAARRPVREEIRSDGRLALCAPRDARQATLWAEFGDASSGEAILAIESGVVHEVELRLRLGSVRTGRLIGRVQDAVTEGPVVAASVSVRGETAVTETNRRGQFILSGVPVGVHELSVRHLGYTTLSHPVTVSRGITTEVDIGLVPDPVDMEPIVATATRPRRLEIKGFYERKYWGELVGGGTFFTAADIERRMPVLISHMIADLSGIRLDCGIRRDSCKIINMRGASNLIPGGCEMLTYLDGVPVRSGTRRSGVDNFVRPVEIAGIEIYRGPASMSAEFGGSDAGCGVVAIWTR